MAAAILAHPTGVEPDFRPVPIVPRGIRGRGRDDRPARQEEPPRARHPGHHRRIDPDSTWYAPADVALVIEVVSEESADRDRSLKPFKYAQAGIPHFWRVEDEAGAPTVHTYELDTMTSTYVATGIHRARLGAAVPFPTDIDLKSLVP